MYKLIEKFRWATGGLGGTELGRDSGAVGATVHNVTIAWICYIVGLLQPITFENLLSACLAKATALSRRPVNGGDVSYNGSCCCSPSIRDWRQWKRYRETFGNFRRRNLTWIPYELETGKNKAVSTLAILSSRNASEILGKLDREFVRYCWKNLIVQLLSNWFNEVSRR